MKNHSWTFDKCPACGSTERIAEQTLNELKQAGRAADHMHASIKAETTTFNAFSPLTQTVPQINVAYDVCAKCGTYYATRAERVETPAHPQQAPAPPTTRPPAIVVPRLKLKPDHPA